MTNHKIKTNTLIGDKNEGGLKLSEFESMNISLESFMGEKIQYRSECTVENHPKLHDSTPRRF